MGHLVLALLSSVSKYSCYGIVDIAVHKNRLKKGKEEVKHPLSVEDSISSCSVSNMTTALFYFCYSVTLFSIYC